MLTRMPRPTRWFVGPVQIVPPLAGGTWWLTYCHRCHTVGPALDNRKGATMQAELHQVVHHKKEERMIAYISHSPDTIARDTAARTIRDNGLKPTFDISTPGVKGIVMVHGWSKDPVARRELRLGLLAGWRKWGANA